MHLDAWKHDILPNYSCYRVCKHNIIVPWLFAFTIFNKHIHVIVSANITFFMVENTTRRAKLCKHLMIKYISVNIIQNTLKYNNNIIPPISYWTSIWKTINDIEGWSRDGRAKRYITARFVGIITSTMHPYAYFSRFNIMCLLTVICWCYPQLREIRIIVALMQEWGHWLSHYCPALRHFA